MNKPKYLILALDTSLSSTGWAIIDSTLGVTDKGTIKTNSKDKLGKRLNVIRCFINKLCINNAFTHVIYEAFPVVARPNAVLKQGAVLGIALEEFFAQGIEVQGITPSTVSKVITGKGKHPKGQRKKAIRNSLEQKYGIKAKNYDESDAIATGIAWLDKEIESHD